MAHRAATTEIALEIAHSVAGALSIYALLPRLARIVADALHAEAAIILLKDDQVGALVAPGEKGQEDRRVQLGAGLIGVCLSENTVLIANSPSDDSRFGHEDRLLPVTYRSIMVAPLHDERGREVGVIQVANALGRPSFTPDDATMLRSLCELIAPHLENCFVFERYKRLRREDMRMMEITSALVSDLQIDTLLEKIVGIVREILNADRCTIFLHNPRTNELWSRIASGLGGQEIRFPAHLGIAGSVFTKAETINIPDAYADPRFNPAVDKKTGYKTNTILCMPIINKKGRAIGVAQVLNKRAGPFGEEDERRLSAFTAQVSIALENANLFDSLLRMKVYNDSILQSLNHGVITLDSHGLIASMNAAGSVLLHKSEQDALGRTLTELLGEHNVWVQASIDKVRQSNAQELVYDTELVLDGGSRLSVNLSAVPLLDPAGAILGTLLIFEDITADKRLKSTMSRYMTKAVLDQVLEGGEALLGGNTQDVTVLFSDIRSFTGIAESMGARDTVALLNAYFTDMVDVVLSHEGILDKYIGDAIMALFGAPIAGPHDADNAVAAAVDMSRALYRFNREQRLAGRPTLEMGIGINSGEVVAGNIGSPKRMDYTVIGDAVNLASRVESATKLYGAKVLATEFTVNALQRSYTLRDVDLIRVKGKTRPVRVLEVIDARPDDEARALETLVPLFEAGVSAYRLGQWDDARARFGEMARIYPGDMPTRLYLDRLDRLDRTGVPADWDGVWVMEGK